MIKPEEENIPVVEFEWESDEDSSRITTEELKDALEDAEMDHLLLVDMEDIDAKIKEAYEDDNPDEKKNEEV